MSGRQGQMRALAIAKELRENPPEWWDYGNCNTCAIEVTVRKFSGRSVFNFEASEDMVDYFEGMTRDQACSIFAEAATRRNIKQWFITPSMVANDLEAWATGKLLIGTSNR